MSYLHRPGLTFSGAFEANVATGNNSPDFYTNPPTPPPPSGLNWNFMGGSEFRLRNCAVGSVVDDEEIAADDAIRTAIVTDAIDRVAAKIVDLDPQWQSASELYGLRVRVVADDVELLAGEFEPAGFRDIGGVPDATGRVRDPHARYVSVLGNLTWAPPGTSGFLDRLRAATKEDLLAIRLTTHTFDFTALTGRIEGAVGPYRRAEPRRFIAGRHCRPRQGGLPLNDFDGVVSGDRLTVDLSNSLAIDAKQAALSTEIRLGLLTQPDVATGAVVSEGQNVITLGGPVPYQDNDWLRTTGGLVTVELPAGATALVEGRRLIDQRPLALIRGSAQRRVAIRETPDGLLVRADNETCRLEPGQPFSTPISVTQYGIPQVDSRVEASIADPNDDPPINTPQEQLHLSDIAPTDAAGWTVLRIDGDERGATSPRPNLDGQLYQVMFAVRNEGDLLVVHLYDRYVPPAEPTWEGQVKDLLKPYAEQYAVMKQRVFDIGDYTIVKNRAEILRFALSRQVTDPNYMPVTRDLSAGKRDTILAWLALPDLPEGTSATPTPLPSLQAAAEPFDDPDAVPAAFVGKLRAARRRAEVLGREELPS